MIHSTSSPEISSVVAGASVVATGASVADGASVAGASVPGARVGVFCAQLVSNIDKINKTEQNTENRFISSFSPFF